MKKIRLTESQLIDLIKKSLSDTQTISEAKTQNEKILLKEYSVVDNTQLGVKGKSLLSNMTGDVTLKRLNSAYATINSVKGLFSEDGKCAVDKLMDYYVGYSYLGASFLDNLDASDEWNDPAFDDMKVKLKNLIPQLQQACAAAKKKDVDDAETKKNGLKNCAKNEKGFVEFKDGPNGSDNGRFGIGEFGKKGYLIISNSGASFTDSPGYNTIYWEYAKFHPKQGKDVAIAKTNASCVNGQISLDAWVKA